MKKCPACLTVHENELMFRCNYTPTTLDKLKIFDEREILCCPNCNFGMIEEDVDEDLLERYYSSDYAGKARKQAETKTKIADSRSKHSYDLRSLSQISLISQYVDIKSELTIVEIGPGMGNFLFSLKQMNFEGKHISFEPQEQAQKFLKQLGSKIEGYNFNIEAAKKYFGSVDLVVMSHALEHFNPGKVPEILNAIHSMLKKGGVFFCEIPHGNLIKYPNAGEMVVPHLSFFSKDSVRHFIKNSDMNLKFLDTCGVSQFTKDEAKRIDELKSKGHFIYDIDPDNQDILRNRNYHNYLAKERINLEKKQRLLNLISLVLGQKFLLAILDWIRKMKQPPITNIISKKHFSYGNDREFLRFIAQK